MSSTANMVAAPVDEAMRNMITSWYRLATSGDSPAKIWPVICGTGALYSKMGHSAVSRPASLLLYTLLAAVLPCRGW